MPLRLAAPAAFNLAELVRQERHVFAAKVRVARAVLAWSQTELAQRAGVSQRAIHKLERGETDPRRMTVRAIEEIWREEGLVFEDMPDGSFRVTVPKPQVGPLSAARSKRRRMARIHSGITRHRRVANDRYRS